MKSRREEEVVKQIEWIIRARWIILAILVIPGILADLLALFPFPLGLLLLLTLTVGIYNFLYSFCLRRGMSCSGRTLNFIKYLQVTGDAAIFTVLIHLTGGSESPFFVLYVLSIIVASILLTSKETYYTAILCAFLYGGLLISEYYRIIPHQYGYSFSNLMREQTTTLILFIILAATAIFCTSAFLASHLSIRSQEAQIRLEDMERYHYTFIEGMPTGAIVVDEKGKIVVFNKAAQEITGFSSQEMIERICSKHPVQGSPLYELSSLLVKALGENKGMKRGEISVSKENGEPIPVGFNISLLRSSEGKVMGAAAIFSDLSEVKAMEARLRLKDRLSDLGSLTSVVAHEMRNPLNVIKMLAQLLEDSLAHSTWEGSAQAIRDTQSIGTQVDICEQRIKELLVFAKPALKVDVLKLEEIQVNDFLDALLTDCKGSSLFSNIELVKRFDGGVPLVLARGEQLRHIFVNLIENAAEAMPDGGRLMVQTKLASETVEVEVTDTGQGIDPEARNHIFEPFCTTKEGGTGLGLAIVQKIVLELDGTIEVESEEGKGTTFKVKLPTRKKSLCAK